MSSDGQQYIILKLKELPPGIVCLGVYLIGIRVDLSSDVFRLKNSIRCFETPQENGQTSYQYMAEILISDADNLQVPLSSVSYWRLLDDTRDSKIIEQASNSLAKLKLASAGLVAAQGMPANPNLKGPMARGGPNGR